MVEEFVDEGHGSGEEGVSKDYIQIIQGSMARSTLVQYRKYSKDYEEFRGEEAVLEFVMSKREEWKASTMWTCVSLLRRFLVAELSVDVGRLERVQGFLKAFGRGQTPKKAPAFTKGQILEFLALCPNEGKSLVVAFGYFAALRVAELVSLKFCDVSEVAEGGLV